MKVGLFDHTELKIYKMNKLLFHKASGMSVNFEKVENEEETINNFAKAIKELELKVGLWLIDNI